MLTALRGTSRLALAPAKSTSSTRLSDSIRFTRFPCSYTFPCGTCTWHVIGSQSFSCPQQSVCAPNTTLTRSRRQTVRCYALRIQNRELLAGDVILLLSFALWKQISAIILSPDFPGWLAPLAFKPVRFAEFFSFAATLIGVWVSSSALVGGYDAGSTRNVATALRITSQTWLAAMPVSAAQLVLVTALQTGSLVGDDGFASSLPLAASGVGEPFGTAAGVLGLMCMWRSYYAVYLDWWSNSTLEEAARLKEALNMVAIMAVLSMVVLQGLKIVWPE